MIVSDTYPKKCNQDFYSRRLSPPHKPLHLSSAFCVGCGGRRRRRPPRPPSLPAGAAARKRKSPRAAPERHPRACPSPGPVTPGSRARGPRAVAAARPRTAGPVVRESSAGPPADRVADSSANPSMRRKHAGGMSRVHRHRPGCPPCRFSQSRGTSTLTTTTPSIFCRAAEPRAIRPSRGRTTSAGVDEASGGRETCHCLERPAPDDEPHAPPKPARRPRGK